MENLDVRAYAEKRKETCSKVKEIIVEQLCLDIEPEFITDNQPLFGRGLELDSIDALELSVGVFTEFSVTISDGQNEVFDCVNSIVDFVLENMEEE